jgi:hypothetical protein
MTYSDKLVVLGQKKIALQITAVGRRRIDALQAKVPWWGPKFWAEPGIVSGLGSVDVAKDCLELFQHVGIPVRDDGGRLHSKPEACIPLDEVAEDMVELWWEHGKRLFQVIDAGLAGAAGVLIDGRPKLHAPCNGGAAAGACGAAEERPRRRQRARPWPVLSPPPASRTTTGSPPTFGPRMSCCLTHSHFRLVREAETLQS